MRMVCEQGCRLFGLTFRCFIYALCLFYDVNVTLSHTDIDGNGFLDQDEVEALFQKEVTELNIKNVFLFFL